MRRAVGGGTTAASSGPRRRRSRRHANVFKPIDHASDEAFHVAWALICLIVLESAAE